MRSCSTPGWSRPGSVADDVATICFFAHDMCRISTPTVSERVFSGSWDATTIPRVRPFEVWCSISPTIKKGGLIDRRVRTPVSGLGLEGQSHLVPEDNMPTYDEIYEKVQATLVDALGVDEEDVTREATLQGDLGAESIDFLDIVFRLERNFGIKIPRGELFPENLMADPEWVADGKLTPKGVGELKARLPFADLSKLADNPAVDRIGDLYTVEMLVQYVQSKLAA